MNVEIVVDHATPEQWRSLASGFTDYSIYQTWEFGACRAAEMKAEVSRIVVGRGDAVAGMAQARIKRTPWFRTGICHILNGPLWRREGSRPADLQVVLEAIHRTYAVGERLLVRIAPNLPECFADEEVLATFDRAGFVRTASAKPLRTFLLDLSPPLDELRRRLQQKWRNCLNQSERKSVTVTESADEAAMTVFETLYAEMKARKDFETGVSLDTFRALQRALPPSDQQTILLAHVNGQPVAGHISSTLGNTCIYLLGASNKIGREHKASYLLQWRSIEKAKQAGARWYDLGGIDREKNPGTYHFKAGLNGQDCAFIGPFLASGGRVRTHFCQFAERVYKRLHP
jgi:hypothetical protein